MECVETLTMSTAFVDLIPSPPSPLHSEIVFQRHTLHWLSSIILPYHFLCSFLLKETSNCVIILLQSLHSEFHFGMSLSCLVVL